MNHLFFKENSELRKDLDELPNNFTNDEVVRMVSDLVEDLKKAPPQPFDNTTVKIMHYGQRHQKLCLSYPMLFRCIVRGSFSEKLLEVFLKNRHQVATGQITDEDAKCNLTDLGVEVIQGRGKRTTNK